MATARKKILESLLLALARLTRARYAPGIVGVTGSVGKTSAKEAIRAVLARNRRVRAPSKSFNNEIGLPLTILGDWNRAGGSLFYLRVIAVSLFRLVVKDRSYPELVVLEYGVDRPGDMRYLLHIAEPQVGVFSAMGEIPVHVEHFTGPDAVVREKSRLIASLPATGFAILNADDEAVLSTRHDTRAHVITFGFSPQADVRISNLQNRLDPQTGDGGVTFKLTYGGSVVPVTLAGAAGRSEGYAAAIGAAVGLIFGMNLVTIAEALSTYRPPAGRSTLVRGIKKTTILDGTYNASPLAVTEALATLESLPGKRKIAVLGDMLELGKYTLERHEAVGRSAAAVVDQLVTVGLRGKFIAEAARKAGLAKRSIAVCTDVMEAAKFLEETLRAGDVVLVKGSQGVRLEKVVKELMADPALAAETLVRQNEEWLAKPGLYDPQNGPIV